MRHLWAGAALAVGLSFNVAQAADKDLVIFDWAGYEDENFYLSYIDKHGDKPTYSFFSDEEEAFNKKRRGVITPIISIIMYSSLLAYEDKNK